MIMYWHHKDKRDAKIVSLTGQVLVYYPEEDNIKMKKFTSYPPAARFLESKGYRPL